MTQFNAKDTAAQLLQRANAFKTSVFLTYASRCLVSLVVVGSSGYRRGRSFAHTTFTAYSPPLTLILLFTLLCN